MLRREIFTPLHSHLVAPALGVIAIGLAVTLCAAPRETSIAAPAAPRASEEIVSISSSRVAAVEPAPPVPVTDVNLVFRAGGALYLKLGAPDAKQKHGARKLHDGDREPTTSAVAEIAAADLPAAHRRWLGKSVLVDGRCTAKVTGFAVVAWLTGDPGYAGETAERWTSRAVFEHGEKMLAARLAGCSDGTFARDAALPPIVVPTVIDDAELARLARAKLLASRPSREAQERWEAMEWSEHRHAAWHHHDDLVTFETIVLRHPTTDVTWVAAYAGVPFSCGGVDISILGLYRVDGRELVAVQERHFGLSSLDHVIDVEGDGELEVIGKSPLGTDVVLERASGDALAGLALPHFYCPC